MPEPARRDFTVIPFEQKVLIFGGRNTINYHILDSVLEFDISTNEFEVMAPLPYASCNMAGVRWGDQAILVGGTDNDGKCKKVFMYDSKTGNVTEMPSMLEERTGCAAVISGNTIVVAGGRGNTAGRLRSVEAFTLGGYSWRYLPFMHDIRSVATATVLPMDNVL
jgi:hypothetical protein